jgi:hypothetical protein
VVIVSSKLSGHSGLKITTPAPMPLLVPPSREFSAPLFGSVSGVSDATRVQKMQEWLKLACLGDRQIVFVTGEAGIENHVGSSTSPANNRDS